MTPALRTPVRTGMVALAAASLAGCMDFALDVEILDRSTARATLVSSMSRDNLAVEIARQEDEDVFPCPGGVLTQEEASVSCTLTQQGPFARLDLASSPGTLDIVPLGNGRVRVGFVTAAMQRDLVDRFVLAADPQRREMAMAILAGHALTLTVSGGPILATNMERAPGGFSASYRVPLERLLAPGRDGENLPREIFAVVQKQ